MESAGKIAAERRNVYSPGAPSLITLVRQSKNSIYKHFVPPALFSAGWLSFILIFLSEIPLACFACGITSEGGEQFRRVQLWPFCGTRD